MDYLINIFINNFCSFRTGRMELSACCQLCCIVDATSFSFLGIFSHCYFYDSSSIINIIIIVKQIFNFTQAFRKLKKQLVRVLGQLDELASLGQKVQFPQEKTRALIFIPVPSDFGYRVPTTSWCKICFNLFFFAGFLQGFVGTSVVCFHGTI